MESLRSINFCFQISKFDIIAHFYFSEPRIPISRFQNPFIPISEFAFNVVTQFFFDDKRNSVKGQSDAGKNKGFKKVLYYSPPFFIAAGIFGGSRQRIRNNISVSFASAVKQFDIMDVLT